jgi:thiol-disulfide isomerase/thioredoxin
MNKSKVFGLIFVLLLGSVAFYFLSSINHETPPAGLIPNTLLDNQSKEVSSDQLSGKYVGLYFSASYCGPCISFTPELIRFRNKYQEEFEVILVGGDGSAKDQARYIKKLDMPWLAMINQSEAAKKASKELGVLLIPSLVILDPSGNVISKKGVDELLLLKEGAMDFWKSATKDA